MMRYWRFLACIGILCLLIGCHVSKGDDDDTVRTITVTITVADLPDPVTYNKNATPEGFVEYCWGITFDTNDSGAADTGDVVLDIMHFKPTGGIETVGSVLDFDAKLRQYINDTQTASKADISRSINGNVITLTVTDSTHWAVLSIDSNTMVYFRTQYYDESGGTAHFDHYPAADTFEAIPGDGQFTDAGGDADGWDLIDMVDMTVTFSE